MSMLDEETELLHGVLGLLDDLAARVWPTTAGARDLCDRLTALTGDAPLTATLASTTEDVAATVSAAHDDVTDALTLIEAMRANTDFTPGSAVSSGSGSSGAVEANFDVVRAELAAMSATAHAALTAAGSALGQAREAAEMAASFAGDRITRQAYTLVDLVEQATARLTHVTTLLDESQSLVHTIQQGPTGVDGAPTPKPAPPAPVEAPQLHRRYNEPASAVVAAVGFDPYATTGPVGDRFHPGTHDCLPDGHKPPRHRHELDTANLLAAEGADVRLTYEDHSVPGKKSIDAWVRWSAQDPGTPTELKALSTAENTSRAVKRHILRGARQLAKVTGASSAMPRGHVLVDGRSFGLAEDDARRAWGQAVGQASQLGQSLPSKTTIIMHDGSILVFRPVLANSGFLPAAETPPRHLNREHLAWTSEWRTP